LNFFKADKSVPSVPDVPSDGRPPFQLLRAIDGDSQLSLSVALDGGKLTASSVATVARELERHLFEPVRIIDHMRVARFSRQAAPSEDLEQQKWTLVFSRGFRKSVKRVGTAVQEKISAAIAELLVAPMTPRGDTVTRLSHDKNGLWRYRMGDHRIIYMPDPDEHQVVFVKFAHREDVYH
jgi:mRNA-degrading endonuclease RelE of RelBE toxin-antitoxin system